MMEADPRQSDPIAYMSRHFVALLTECDAYSKDGKLLGRGVVACSGFLLEVHGLVFWVTAGHCLKDELDGEIAAGRLKVVDGSFMDCFSNEAKHFESIPFTYEPGCGYYVEDPAEGFDYGLILLDTLKVRAFAANGVIPISRKNWIHQAGLTFDFYRMLGIPKDRVVVSKLPDGSLDTKVGQAMLAVNTIGLDEVGEPPRGAAVPTDSWFIGRIDRECSIPDIAGMSGGPIYGFRWMNGNLYYHCVALQSRWWNVSRTVFGCSLPRFAEEVYQNLHQLFKEHAERN